MSATTDVVTAIRQNMPAHAEQYLTQTDSSGAALTIHWKLGADKARPNKYSKTIVVLIPRELLEDFSNYPSNMQKVALERIRAYIGARVAPFDPNHDAPREVQPPVENWPIHTGDSFG
jgi:hypothetical protein